MADAPVVHLPQRDYDDAAKRRDWQRSGYAVTAEFGDHPVRTGCAQCSEPQERPAGDYLDDLTAELACLVHPAAEAAARQLAARIFRYGMTAGWDRAVAAATAGPEDPALPADAMRSRVHG